jgi:hypothetical protein
MRGAQLPAVFARSAIMLCSREVFVQHERVFDVSNRRRASRSPRPHPVRPRVPKPPSDRSAALVQRLNRLPRFVAPVLTFALLVYGLLGHPVWLAVACLVLVIAFLCWLSSLSWARTPTRGRLLRELMILLIIIATVGRIAGWN